MLRRTVSILLAVALGVVGLVLTAGPAAAAPVVVTTTEDNLSIRSVSLRRALALAESDAGATTIVLAAGQTYVLDRCNATAEDTGSSGDLDFTPGGDLTIEGNGASIVQDCAGERVLHFQTGSTVTMRNLAVTSGDAEDDAGQPDAQGGGILAGDLVLDRVDVVANAAEGSGGGIRATSLNATRSEISGNRSDVTGGGVTAFSSVALHRSTVTGNTGGETGGVAAGFGVTLDRSTVADNTETTPGVGTSDGVEIDVFSGGVTLDHSTVRGGDGDGAAIDAGLTATASVVARGQADAACTGGASNGHSADDDGTCGFSGGTDQSAASTLALTAPVAANGGPTPTIKPGATSTLRDHDPGCAADTDQRGTVVPQGEGCEIGAVELEEQPDGLLRRAGATAFVGDDTYQATPGSQVVAQNLVNGSVSFDWRVGNDGEVADTFTLAGPGNDLRFSIRYFRGVADVTGPVVAGTFVTPRVPVGGRVDLRVVVTRRSGAPAGVVRSLGLAAAAGGEGPGDVVTARVRTV